MSEVDNVPEETQDLDPVLVRGQLMEESTLVSGLVSDCLSVLHQSDSDVSLIGEFVGLLGVAGGLGVATIRAAKPEQVRELAQFFADRCDAAARTFRRIEMGEEIDQVAGAAE